MPNRKAKKKWANAHLFQLLSQRNRTRTAKENYVPSDFVILAIFRDKGKRSGLNRADLASIRNIAARCVCAA
jgi:hypothetical protein